MKRLLDEGWMEVLADLIWVSTVGIIALIILGLVAYILVLGISTIGFAWTMGIATATWLLWCFFVFRFL